MRLIPQERVQQRGADSPRPRITSRGRNCRSGPDHCPRAYLEAYHRPNRRCVSGDATPSTDNPDSSEDSGNSTNTVLWLSGRRACCDAATDEEDTSCCLTKETHQPSLKCETPDCSFEASSQHVSKNRGSWDRPKIDDFVRS